MNRLFFGLCLLGTYSLYTNEGWLEGDYLLWATKKAPAEVPLVTSASLTDPLPGALGQPGTKIRLGDKEIDMGWRSGFRITLGRWIGGCQQFGLDGNFFMLPKKWHHKSIHTSGEPGSPNVAVPIDDVTGLWGLNVVLGETIFILPGPLSGPGFKGRFTLKLSNKLLGSELNTLVNLISRIHFIGGFRWVQLQESLSFIGKTAALSNSIATGFYDFKDSFKTYNNFFGPQIGLKADYNVDRWLFNGFAKVGFGCMHQKLRIEGKSETSNGNLFYMTKNTGNEVLKGGLFSEPTNRGSQHHNRFAIVFETGVHLSYQFSRCFEMGVGYDFLWLNQVVRPGKQIDRKINPTRTALAKASRATVGIGPDKPVPFGIPAAAPLPRGPKRPKFKHRTTGFWAQGFVFDINFKF